MWDLPLLVFAFTFVALWLAEFVGASLHKKLLNIDEDERKDFDLITASTLTLLGLIIGFTFSMAISRYDQRNNDESQEAGTIGTEYLRAGLLPAADAAKVRMLLRNYLDQRILFFTVSNDRQLQQINADTAQLQNDMWSAVQAPAMTQPTPLAALAVSGMNDVLGSRGNTQSAWWDRIPRSAWNMMAAIAICCNVLVGYRARRSEMKSVMFLILPGVVSISFFLISDIDSPRGGIIRVYPQDLQSLSRSLPAH